MNIQCTSIQRCREKYRVRLQEFGPYEEAIGHHFIWLLGEGKVGMSQLPSTQAESFYGGFVVADDTLVVKPSDKRPYIRRKNKAHTTLGGSEERGVRHFIGLLEANDTLHAYLSKGEILTFSSSEPDSKWYEKAKPMPVEIDEEAVRQEGELRELLEKMQRH